MSLEERIVGDKALHVIIPPGSEDCELNIKSESYGVYLINGARELTIGSYNKRLLQRTPLHYIAVNPYLFIVSMITMSYMMGGTAMAAGICITLPATLFAVSYSEIHDALRVKRVEAKLRAAGAKEDDIFAAKIAALYWQQK